MIKQVATLIRRFDKIYRVATRELSKYLDIAIHFIKPKNRYLNIINQNNCVLIITHDLGGGSDFYLQNIIKQFIEQNQACLIMISHPAGYKLKYRDRNQSFWVLISSLIKLETQIQFNQIERIFLNNYVRGREPIQLIHFLLHIKAKHSTPIIIALHDFFPICPSYPLINDEKQYCAIPSDINRCENCRLHNPYNQYQHITITAWRKAWEIMLIQANEIKCFSDSSCELLLKAYPVLNKTGNISIIPHSVAHIHAPIKLKTSKTLHIGIVGNISSLHKGVHLVKDMLKLMKQHNMKTHITVIGSAFQLADDEQLTVLGAYQIDQLANIITNTNITVFFLPSIWPETFSYVTHELIQLNVPVAVFDLGAQAEAIKKYKKGYVIPKIDANTALEHLQLFHKQINGCE